MDESTNSAYDDLAGTNQRIENKMDIATLVSIGTVFGLLGFVFILFGSEERNGGATFLGVLCYLAVIVCSGYIRERGDSYKRCLKVIDVIEIRVAPGAVPTAVYIVDHSPSQYLVPTPTPEWRKTL